MALRHVACGVSDISEPKAGDGERLLLLLVHDGSTGPCHRVEPLG